MSRKELVLQFNTIRAQIIQGNNSNHILELEDGEMKRYISVGTLINHINNNYKIKIEPESTYVIGNKLYDPCKKSVIGSSIAFLSGYPQEQCPGSDKSNFLGIVFMYLTFNKSEYLFKSTMSSQPNITPSSFEFLARISPLINPITGIRSTHVQSGWFEYVQPIKQNSCNKISTGSYMKIVGTHDLNEFPNYISNECDIRLYY